MSASDLPIWFVPPPPSPQVPRAPEPSEQPPIKIEIDGTSVEVNQGVTILDACRQFGKTIPTLCYLETLTPVNVCRICVVEVKGARVLVPACSRKVEEGMVVVTQSERVRLARKVVLELLASSVDLSTAPELIGLLEEYEGCPDRFGLSAGRLPPRLHIDNPLYVRDYAKCVLCYKCVEACGADAQNTFAIAVAGRGFEAGIATEWEVPLPESACVYCGNCIAVCPTGALMAKAEFDLRTEGNWHPERQTKTETICGYCGVGCTVQLHVQDGRIVKATAPFENFVTRGNLCIKGRFGFAFVHAVSTGEEA